MTASDRVKLIKSINSNLDSESWEALRMTLDQLGIPKLQDFSGDKNQFIIRRCQHANDEDLIALAKHLEIDVGTTVPEKVSSVWTGGYVRLFISHISAHKEEAQQLKMNLEVYGICGFVAHSDIEPTKEWQDEIERALKSCDALVALMVEKFHNSNWTDQEIGFVVGRDILVIPVNMGQLPYGFLQKYQALPFKDISDLAKQVFQALNKNPKTTKIMSSALIARFENASSFAEARSLIQHVEAIRYWNDELIERLSRAPTENNQISKAIGVPGKIKALVAAYGQP